MQAEGTPLQTILEAFRDEPRLALARVSVFEELLSGAAGEAEGAEAGQQAGSTPADVMRQLQGPALDAVYALLEQLASAEQLKAGFRRIFARLLNVGKAERLVLAQIQATVQAAAQQGGSSQPVPQNRLTIDMLQNVGQPELWPPPVRAAVGRFDLMSQTADILESARDLPQADVRRLWGERAWPHLLSLPPPARPPCWLSHPHP